MTQNSHPTIPTTNRLFSSLPLESLIRMAASSDDAVEGLQAMAIEIGGRDGGKINAIAEQLRRGGNFANEKAFGPQTIPILQAAVNENAADGATFQSNRLPRWVMLEDQRSHVRTRLNRVVWAGLFYLLVASAVGFGLQKVSIAFLDELGLSSDRFWLLAGNVDVNEVLLVSYAGLIILTSLLMLSWACRTGLGVTGLGGRLAERSAWLNALSSANESFWNAVPFVGSTCRSIDIAQMTEEISRSLSVGWTFPNAIRSAAEQSKSTILRNWLFRSADELDRGESVRMVLNVCPLGAHWLRAMSQVLSRPNTDRNIAEQWSLVSDKLHALMNSRLRRASTAVLPATVLLSVSILLVGWANLVGLLIELISGLL